ncbi:MAG: response regulator [Syntrophales bacterium]|jgi:two-component system response regulator PilR (NtrC family)
MTVLSERRKRVLVVDDDEVIRELLTDYLNMFGYEVVCAVNGQEAVRKYTKGHFDIVLSDLVMSPMDGLELLGEIRKMDPEAIFIMITGYPSINSAMEAMKRGAKDYVTKPFNIDEIGLKMERVLLERSLKGRLRNVQGLIWALVISIPVWLILGIILARLLK